ncbi:hypothetical protein NQ317_013513, partial [Molorchus minor]
FTYGLTVPLVLPRRSINFSLCAQVNYNMPYNVSNFVPNTIATRDNNFLDISRKNGEECLLRAICEIAETPLCMSKITRRYWKKSFTMFSRKYSSLYHAIPGTNTYVIQHNQKHKIYRPAAIS